MSDSETTTPVSGDKPIDIAPVMSSTPPRGSQTPRQSGELSLSVPRGTEDAGEDTTPEETAAEETTEEATDESGNDGDDESGVDSDAGSGEGDASGEESDDDSSGGGGESSDTDDGADDSDDGEGEEEGDADGGEERTDDSGSTSRRARPDKRTRAELAFNQERAERAARESERFKGEAERWKQRFEQLAEGSVEGEELVKAAAEEEKAAAEKAKEVTAHVPTQDDRDWLQAQARAFSDSVSAEDAKVFVERLTQNAPEVVTAVRQLDDPVQMIEDLAALQEGKPDIYQWIVSGTAAEVGRKLLRMEIDLQRQASAPPAKKPKQKAKPAAKKATKKDAVDKPVDVKSARKPAQKAAKDKVDAHGVSWKDETTIEKKSWPAYYME